MTSGFSDEKKALDNIKLLASTPLRDYIRDIIEHALSSPSPDDAVNNLERIIASYSEKIVKSLTLQPKTFSLQPVIYIAGASNFLSNILVKDSSNLECLFLKNGLSTKKVFEDFSKELNKLCPASARNSFEAIAKILRQYRGREYLRIGARDVLNLATMEETTQELSDLASSCLALACRFCLEKLKGDYGVPMFIDTDGTEKEAEFAVIGMGKLGGRELNFSSDIDIIYIYSSDKGEVVKTPDTRQQTTDTRHQTSDNRQQTSDLSLHAFFVKLSELITKLIGQVTEDGIVFRVDLNLRPEGKNGDLANSLRSAEIYYESWGQTWERAAMLKARTVAGSVKLGEGFLKMLEPFIYRRYLDFTAIEDIKGMKEKIDLSLLRRAPDTIDVKLGYGGIREIEFFVQAMQIINAGKDKEIRAKNTLETIELLERQGYITAEDSNILRESYIFLRNVEHKIQIVEGRQTQAIPVKANEITKLARMMGFRDEAGARAEELFREKYSGVAEDVHEIYEKLFYKPSEELKEGVSKDVSIILSDEIEKGEGIEILKRLGFKEPEKAFENIRLLKHGSAFAHISQKARNILNKILPFLISRITSSPDPDMALTHLERFVSRIGGRGIFYSLLAENKKVMELLVKLIPTSAFLSHTFIEHPEIMDYLLSIDVHKPYKNKDEIRKELSLILDEVSDYEEKLDALRRFKNTEILRIGINDIFGEIDISTVSRQIAFLADAAIEKSCEIGLEEISKRYGMPSDKRFAVLALGKLGGEEITYSSDLDLIFVYGGAGETNGLKKVTNHEFFVKLCQKIIAALSVITREGFVFKVDARLRPSGSSGPIVITEEAFLKYHESKAEIWERQAGIKARFAAGDKGFGDETISKLHSIIYAGKPIDKDITELLRIRKRMELEIAKETSDRYNIKTGKGGLVDIEFAVQILQLKNNVRSQNTMQGLDKLSGQGIINRNDCDTLKDAYNFYRLMENRIRIVHDRADDVLTKGSDDVLKLGKRMGFEGDDAGDRLMECYLNHS
ncbi:MAG: bifunctional [glutamate--ammonia ligase]-adenylyl-L-tyrosine phosphorylase/[glutamate--ammonia-ligase] adenylyltransferase, partial [Deltaproteobacteria bacterium]|nr:bifunctional [glutamate--ammonia ligase]-adenylyl-L-tyrosine phosphorylase/[glutamate--ammonia-ligase] adenylyltransferase [Deltaproteobacteria bacterium]